jgi:hypothetical protein
VNLKKLQEQVDKLQGIVIRQQKQLVDQSKQVMNFSLALETLNYKGYVTDDDLKKSLERIQAKAKAASNNGGEQNKHKKDS